MVKKRLSFGAGVVVGAGITLGGIAIYEALERERDSLMYRASQLADLNLDGVTTQEEWKGVYRKMGIHYDERSPIQLNDTMLENYIKERESEEKIGGNSESNSLPIRNYKKDYSP